MFENEKLSQNLNSNSAGLDLDKMQQAYSDLEKRYNENAAALNKLEASYARLSSKYEHRILEFRDMDLVRRVSNSFSSYDAVQISKFVADTLSGRLGSTKAIFFLQEHSINENNTSIETILGRGQTEAANSFIQELVHNENALKDQSIFRCIYKSGIDKDCEASDFTFHIRDSGLFWTSIKSAVPFSTADIISGGHDPLYEEELKQYALHDLGIYQWIPLLPPGDQEVIGLIGLDTDIHGDLESKFVSMLSLRTARALYSIVLNRRLENSRNELKQQIQKLATLYDVGRALSAIDNRNNLLTDILCYATRIVSAAKGSIMLFDDSGEFLETKVVYGIPKDVADKILRGQIKTTKFRRGEGIAGKVAESKVPAIIHETDKNDNFVHSEQSNASYTKSILCVPLLVHDDVIGVLNITNKSTGALFDSKDLDIIMQVADQAALAIYNAQLYELAVTDSLTKLFIRRHFFQKFADEIKRARRSKQPISLLMIDIDHFKSVNDVYGHPCGDHVLIEVASVLKNAVRDLDIVGRYGGEEFAILLLESDSKGAMAAARRIHKLLELSEITWNDGGKKIELRISVSMGIATYPKHAQEPSAIVQCADNAMYYSKRSGRNKTTIYSEEIQKFIESDKSRDAAKKESENR